MTRHRDEQKIFKVSAAESARIDVGLLLAQMKFSAWARYVLLREVDRLEQEAQQGAEIKAT